MLNYANLNDVEFEALCCDIMERKLNISLRRFGPGKDGGVDLTDDVDKKNVIVQVKHYQASSVSALVSSLKKELPKVEKLRPKKYYICCSRQLSVNNINALYKHFRAYMDSDRQIITIIEIDKFLKEPENRDILKKHFKLWLDDTGILQDLENDKLFVDCEAFLDDAEDLHKLFVRTSAFDRALKVLESDQTLCILGDPGVGKSITSKMLVLHYASQGYRVRYTSNVSDLGTLKASLRNEEEVKEIVLLDDCFGQAYFEMKSTQSSELISLIKYVKRRPNKMLILNSRITIFQEARRRQRDLVQCLERDDFKVQFLDVNKISTEEKARILYNHLAFSGIPNDYFVNIKKDYRYRQILNHRNYNPRIIEFVCHPKRYQSVAPSDYYEFILKHLDNPKEMWKDEYEYRLQPADRILIQTIYSLTTTTVDAELVRQCFERRIATIPTIDKTVDQFKAALERLNKGFIKIIDNQGMKLSMHNPSVNDFLDGRLRINSAEKDELIKSICTVNQLRLLSEENRMPYIVDLLQTESIDQLVFLTPNDKADVIGHSILASGLCMERYKPEVLNYIINRPYGSIYFLSGLLGKVNVRGKILDTKIWEFYDLKGFFEESDHLYRFLSPLEFDDAVEFISSVDELFYGKNRIYYVQQVENYLNDYIDEFCNVDASDYELELDIEDAIRFSSSCDFDELETNEDDFDPAEAAAILDEKVREIVFERFESILSTLPNHFRFIIDYIQEDDIDVHGSEDLVEEFLSDIPGHYERDDDEEPREKPYSVVDAIFQR